VAICPSTSDLSGLSLTNAGGASHRLRSLSFFLSFCLRLLVGLQRVLLTRRCLLLPILFTSVYMFPFPLPSSHKSIHKRCCVASRNSGRTLLADKECLSSWFEVIISREICHHCWQKTKRGCILRLVETPPLFSQRKVTIPTQQPSLCFSHL